MGKIFSITVAVLFLLSCGCIDKQHIAIDTFQDCQGQYGTNCYLIQNGDSSLLYKTYNPVEVDTVLLKEGQTFYVLKEDITTEESLYEYLVYDTTNDILYDSDILAILDSISSSDIAAIFNSNKKLEYKADDIDLKSNKLRIQYKATDKIKYMFLDLTQLGTPPYIRP